MLSCGMAQCGRADLVLIVELERRVAGLPSKGCGERLQSGVKSARGVAETLARPIQGECGPTVNLVDRYSSVRAEKPGLVAPGQG